MNQLSKLDLKQHIYGAPQYSRDIEADNTSLDLDIKQISIKNVIYI